MGTDIHMRAEVQPEEGAPWKALGGFPNPMYDPIVAQRNEPASWDWLSRPTTPEPFHDRNYVVFAVLADVRNGFGFAGVPTHKPLEPISEPRGLPEDLADDHVIKYDDDEGFEPRKPGESAQEFANRVWIFGDHSQSYLTLRDLLSYDWSRTLHDGGVIHAKQYVELRHQKNAGLPYVPGYWSGSITGPGITTIAESEAAELDAADLLEREKLYVRASWDRPLSDPCSRFLDLVDRMCRWNPRATEGAPFQVGDPEPAHGHRAIGLDARLCWHHPDRLRLVFGFDS